MVVHVAKSLMINYLRWQYWKWKLHGFFCYGIMLLFFVGLTSNSIQIRFVFPTKFINLYVRNMKSKIQRHQLVYITSEQTNKCVSSTIDNISRCFIEIQYLHVRIYRLKFCRFGTHYVKNGRQKTNMFWEEKCESRQKKQRITFDVQFLLKLMLKVLLPMGRFQKFFYTRDWTALARCATNNYW